MTSKARPPTGTAEPRTRSSRRERSISHSPDASGQAGQTGWITLFDGSNLNNWEAIGNANWRLLEGGIVQADLGNGFLVSKQEFGDFELRAEFWVDTTANSGVFIRTYPLTQRLGKDVGFNGIEVAIDDTTTAGYHDTGAIYDLVKPSKNAMKPPGQWNHLVVTCDGPRIAVELNGETVTRMDLDEWTAPNRRPDGSAHKFDVAYKDHPRSGYIGLQDHGSACWFKNIKIKPLKR